jgi:hypothetical protein
MLPLLVALSVPPPAAAQALDVVELTVTQVQAGYAAGTFTAVELTRAFLERIDRHEERLNGTQRRWRRLPRSTPSTRARVRADPCTASPSWSRTTSTSPAW